MRKEELVQLIEVAQALAFDPESSEDIAFSGESLYEVLHGLQHEVIELEQYSANELLEMWQERVKFFRDTYLASARERTSYAFTPDRVLLLTGERDALKAREKCQKGAGGFHRPRQRR